MALWNEYNANPRHKRVGDCTVRAISVITDQDWQTTYSKLALQGYMDFDIPSSNAVWQSYLKSLGYKRHAIPDKCPECYSVRSFCDDHPRGRYLLGLDGHVVAVKDAIYYDTWDSGDETVIYYFELEEDQQQHE